MNRHGLGRSHSTVTPRVGLLCEAGMGNIGNDASLEAVLNYLRAKQPDVAVDVICANANTVRSRYEVPATSMAWYSSDWRTPRPLALLLRVFGKLADPLRIASWVRKHDAVIVTGTGILDATLPVRPWGPPLVLFAASVAGRLFGVKVAYVSVGAGPIGQAMSRRLFYWAARTAHYRSFRDAESRAAVQGWGLSTSGDAIYPDLAFALPIPSVGAADASSVCLGVMDYHGANEDRHRSQDIRQSYIDQMKMFVRWLLKEGRQVRLLVGDTNGSDDRVVQEILAAMRSEFPDLDPSRLIANPVTNFNDVLREVSLASTAVAIRFHNIVAALMLGKPTVAISYGPKNDSLMADAGLAEFCIPVKNLDHAQLVVEFSKAEERAAGIRGALLARGEANAERLADQFAVLSADLFGV